MSEDSTLTLERLAALKADLRNFYSPSNLEKKVEPGPAAIVKSEGQIFPKLGVIFFSGLSLEKYPYELLLEVAQYADKAGFNAIWTPERHFTEVGGGFPNPSVLAAALAVMTRNIRLRAGSINLPLHDPLRVAEDWGVVDNLSGGRVDIAIAPGWHIRDFVLKPENFRNKFHILNESREQLKRIWRGEPLARLDANSDVQEVVTYPRPVQSELPMWLTTSQSEEAWKFAGENGLNVLTALINFPPEELRKRIKLYRLAREGAGLNPSTGTVSLMLHTFVDADEDRGIEKVRPILKEYLKSFVSQHKTADRAAENDKTKILQSLNEDTEDFLDVVFERYVATSSIIGGPKSVKEKLVGFHQMGVDEVACLLDFGVEKVDVLESLRLLSEITRAKNYEDL
jgi:natural product biosynthesis luciferase-like monooxygenase protein